METLLAFVIGGLYAAGVYLLLRRSIVKLVLGLALVGHATNLMIFTVGRLTRGLPPIVPPGLDAPLAAIADPLPQALILTAIVIGFGVQAFALTLLKRAHRMVGTDDLDEMNTTDRMD